MWGLVWSGALRNSDNAETTAALLFRVLCRAAVAAVPAVPRQSSEEETAPNCSSRQNSQPVTSECAVGRVGVQRALNALSFNSPRNNDRHFYVANLVHTADCEPRPASHPARQQRARISFPRNISCLERFLFPREGGTDDTAQLAKCPSVPCPAADDPRLTNNWNRQKTI